MKDLARSVAARVRYDLARSVTLGRGPFGHHGPDMLDSEACRRWPCGAWGFASAGRRQLSYPRPTGQLCSFREENSTAELKLRRPFGNLGCRACMPGP